MNLQIELWGQFYNSAVFFVAVALISLGILILCIMMTFLIKKRRKFKNISKNKK